MDPLTHALTGAAVAWLAAGEQRSHRCLLLGAFAAVLPDVDVLIRSEVDPLLAIEHHRGFTHSLLAVPFGGVIAALPFSAGSYRPKARVYSMVGALAYLTHSILDAATTYGTQLFWPFSHHRVGLDIISIIDPLFTAIILIGVIAALRNRRAVVASALGSALVWLLIGTVQRERAVAAQDVLSRSRGHAPQRGAVFPTIGNTIVWRSIYEARGMLHIDRIRVPWFGDATYAATTSQPLAVLEERSPEAAVQQRFTTDLARFSWFSDGWIARDPADLSIIGDARYSLRAGEYAPVWGVRFHPKRQPPTEWVNRTRDRDVRVADVLRELVGDTRTFEPLP